MASPERIKEALTLYTNVCRAYKAWTAVGNWRWCQTLIHVAGPSGIDLGHPPDESELVYDEASEEAWNVFAATERDDSFKEVHMRDLASGAASRRNCECGNNLLSFRSPPRDFLYCPSCFREYSRATGDQIPNYAWAFVNGEWVRKRG